MNLKFTKSALACMAMALCLCNEANAQKKFCLQEVEAQLEGDYTYHGYNKDGLLDSTYIYTSYYDEEIYHLYKYNDMGLMTISQGYCILPNADNEYREFTKTYEIIYEYDENGRKISRKNYNLDVFGGTNEYLLGGMYTYIYDENGVLTQRKLYWDEAGTDLFETTNYTYDEAGRLVGESYLQHSFGSTSEEMALTYIYDEAGRLIRLKTEVMNHDTGALTEDDNLVYKYDENGNLVSRLSYATNIERPNEEHVLIYYTDTLATDVAMPINYEDDMDFYKLSKNVVKQDSIYRRDAEGETFDLFDVQDWRYGKIDDAAGIENVYEEGKILSVSRDADGNVVLNGVENRENVRIYDLNGKVVGNGTYNGKVNVSALPHGMYVIATRQGCVKISR